MTAFHHALLIVTERERALGDALRALDMPESGHEGNPDIHVLILEQFGIDEARSLRQLASLRPVREQKRVFIIGCERLTGEAQNALLKLFEDPPATARFVLGVPSEDRLIATLRSRLMVAESVAASREVSLGREFATLSYADRLALIAARLKEKDETWARRLLRELEVLAGAQVGEGRAVLREIMEAEQYMGARGASSKMLLEHVALTFPTLKGK